MMATKKHTTLLIDSDIVAFKFASSSEVATDWGNDIWTLHADAREARGRMFAFVEELMDTLKADDLVVCLSDPSRHYWRHDIFPAYKSGRVTRKPMILGHLKEALAEKYNSYVRPGLEADDIMGILATHPTIIPGTKIIVSLDKDMKTIPGNLYNWSRPKDGVVRVSRQEADYRHMLQTLMGDATDGYPGVPGVGPKKAERILEPALDDSNGYFEVFDTEAAWELVVKAYHQAKLSEEVALQMARVARICRACDYDFKKKEVKLWKPT
jgi:DNA polymerase-1